ncbi:trk system potassium uptake protein TrkA [Reichenbachiella agariperforans]|uniref:Trk system potassium uptake protein TrkA n=1 Tax=Reichenbachiella agariperforans TaxID=156994 RepID=A0A1M6JII3_REIAG|nr:TrkA family potassium uptake protein [Reichenbachiella agariperforans]SHJ46484.1 trk system potassium uptake protein TrkA [Reichenbachiella agariperforans]
MKYVIIGLGVFGASLAKKLTESGNEVIGVDNIMSKVDALREAITHTICLDSTDPQAVTNLPLADTDVVIVCIGENEGANIMTTALMKKMKAKRLISRAVSLLHETVLEAMGVDEIVHPEEETANRWSKKLNITGVVDSFQLTGDHNIIEATVPTQYVSKSLQELNLQEKYNVVVLTTMRVTEEKNDLGSIKKTGEINKVANANTILNKHDILVLYGNMSDIRKLLEDGE